MTTFIHLFIAVLTIAGSALMLLALINGLRKKQPGCSGDHECVVYKGEKVMCPACELRENSENPCQQNG